MLLEILRNGRTASNNLGKYVDFGKFNNIFSKWNNWNWNTPSWPKNSNAGEGGADQTGNSSWVPPPTKYQQFDPTVPERHFDHSSPPTETHIDFIKDGPYNNQFPEEVKNVISKSLDFFEKRDALNKIIDFSKVFGPKGSFMKEEDELKKLATNEDQIKKNIEDYIISKRNMHQMRKKAYEFEDGYKKLLAEYDQCINRFQKMTKDIKNNMGSVSNPLYDQLMRDLEDLEFKLSKNKNIRAKATDNYDDEHSKLVSLISEVLERIRDFDDLQKQIDYKNDENASAEQKIRDLRNSNQRDFFKVGDLEKELKELRVKLGPRLHQMEEMEAKLKVEEMNLKLNEQDLSL